MLTQKDYCDYETCVALMEIGCRIETEWYIHQPSYERGSCYLCFGIPRETSVLDECDYIPRLSLYEAQKWLREEKFLLIVVDRLLNGEYVFSVVDILNYSEEKNGTANSYEEALLEGIKEAVKILKKE